MLHSEMKHDGLGTGMFPSWLNQWLRTSRLIWCLATQPPSDRHKSSSQKSCSLVSERWSINPRKQVAAECNTSLSEPSGIHAAKVHVTSYKLQSYYRAYLHISVFLLCCCFFLSFSPTSPHIHSIFQVWTF